MSVVTTSAGQQIQTVSTNTAGVGNIAVFPLGLIPSATLSITGTFSLTLTFEASIDGLTWLPIGLTKLSDGTIVATATAVGLFAVTNTGLASVRARCTAFTSGAADISLGAGTW